MRSSMRGQSVGLHPDAGPSPDLEGADAPCCGYMAAAALLADKDFDADSGVIEPLLARGKFRRDPVGGSAAGSTRL